MVLPADLFQDSESDELQILQEKNDAALTIQQKN